MIKDLNVAPVCKEPKCCLMHRGLSHVFFFCECGAWHPIQFHPKDNHYTPPKAAKEK